MGDLDLQACNNKKTKYKKRSTKKKEPAQLQIQATRLTRPAVMMDDASGVAGLTTMQNLPGTDCTRICGQLTKPSLASASRLPSKIPAWGTCAVESWMEARHAVWLKRLRLRAGIGR
jgi:hypothetical protein